MKSCINRVHHHSIEHEIKIKCSVLKRIFWINWTCVIWGRLKAKVYGFDNNNNNDDPTCPSTIKLKIFIHTFIPSISRGSWGLFISFPAYGSMNTNRPWKCNIILRNVNLKWRFFIVKLRSANKLANSKTCINWFKVNLTFLFILNLFFFF